MLRESLCLRTPNQIIKTAGCIDGCIVNRYICFKLVLYFLFSCMHFSVLCSVFCQENSRKPFSNFISAFVSSVILCFDGERSLFSLYQFISFLQYLKLIIDFSIRKRVTHLSLNLTHNVLNITVALIFFRQNGLKNTYLLPSMNTTRCCSVLKSIGCFQISSRF